MRFIQVHALVHFLLPVNVSSDGLHIYLLLFSAALLRVGRRIRLSSHILYTRLLMRLVFNHNRVFLVLQGVSSNTSAFRKNLEGSAPFLRVPHIFCFLSFLEEAPKMLADLLTVSAWAGLSDIFSSVSVLVARLMLLLQPRCLFGGFVYFVPSLRGCRSSWGDCFTI